MPSDSEDEGGWAWVEAPQPSQPSFKPPAQAPSQSAPSRIVFRRPSPPATQAAAPKQPPAPVTTEADVRAMLPPGFGRDAISEPKFDHSTSRRPQDFSHLIPSAEPPQPVAEPVPAPPHADSESESDDDDDDLFKLPISHSVELKSDAKAISSLSLDPSGSRLITGDMGYHIRFWDFYGMDRELKPWRDLEPSPGHEVNGLIYNSTGSHFLVTVSSAQTKVYDREGKEEAETMKGDMYVYDKRKTPGHTHEVCQSRWDPRESMQFFTASADSTLRMWNLEDYKESGFRSRGVVRTHKTGGKYVGICAMDISHDGKVLATGGIDGSLQIWNRGQKETPVSRVHKAHSIGPNPPRVDITCLTFSEDGVTMLSRSTDGTVKVWDIRMMSKGPSSVIDDLPCVFDHTDVIFSPDEKLILTGTVARKQRHNKLLQAEVEAGLEEQVPRTYGRLVSFNRYTMEPVTDTAISPAAVQRLLWHGKLNQIFVGSSDGSTHVLYDPELSQKGVIESVGRAPKRRDPFADIDFQRIVAPYAPKMDGTRDQRGRPAVEQVYESIPKARMMAQRQARSRPEAPLPGSGHSGEGTGRGRGGRLGSALWTKVIQDEIAKEEGSLRLHADIRSVDPAKKLREIGEKLEKEGGGLGHIDRAYEGTGQKRLLDYEALDLERQLYEEKMGKKTKKG